MSHVFARPTLWRRLRPILLGFDLPLLVVVFALAGLGMVTMYSVGYDHGTRFQDHGRAARDVTRKIDLCALTGVQFAHDGITVEGHSGRKFGRERQRGQRLQMACFIGAAWIINAHDLTGEIVADRNLLGCLSDPPQNFTRGSDEVASRSRLRGRSWDAAQDRKSVV